MIEKHVPVTIEVARAYCDNTGHCIECKSELKPTGIMVAGKSPRYEHQCENCGVIEKLPNQYPHLIYNGATSL